jgi:hypothetical protein
VLPDPVWNDRSVLVWSMLDIERIRLALSAVDKLDKAGAK